MIRNILAAAVFWAIATTAHAAPPTGIYALWHSGTPIGPAAAGVTCAATWEATEPSRGTYDWTTLDQCIAAATGRPVQIGIDGGVFSPAWVYADGARAMAETWAWKWGYPMCSAQQFPLPWDSTYLAAWNALTAALGVRYSHDAQVVAIKVSVLMSKDEEDVFPTTAPSACPGAPDVTTAWQKAGYRPALMTQALASGMAAYRAAFPATHLVLQTGSWAMPGINAAGQAAKPDYALTTALTQQFAAAAGAWGIVQNNGLQDVAWQYANPTSAPLALQEGAPITGDASCADAGGKPPCNAVTVLSGMLAKARGQGATFVEVYPPDIGNPAMATEFEGFGKAAATK